LFKGTKHLPGDAKHQAKGAKHRQGGAKPLPGGTKHSQKGAKDEHDRCNSFAKSCDDLPHKVQKGAVKVQYRSLKGVNCTLKGSLDQHKGYVGRA
jgi:hypothetical protein